MTRDIGVVAIVATCIAIEALPSQCTTQWLPGLGPPGTERSIHATATWDPDGPGPLTPRLVIAGEFTAVGPMRADAVAAFDPATGQWSAFGPGLYAVYCLLAMPNGDLIAGGMFHTQYGAAADHIARWNGSAWVPLGTGMAFGGTVYALSLAANGDLIAGGQFTAAGGVAAAGVARWNGSAWSALGSGVGGVVYALATRPNGELIAGGFFPPSTFVMGWNGTSWSTLGAGVDHEVRALLTLPNGDVVAGGEFLTAGAIAAPSVALWNGTSWSAMGAGLPAAVRGLCRRPNGDLVAGTGSGQLSNWNGSSWTPIGTTQPVTSLTTLPNGDVVAGSRQPADSDVNLVRWDGTTLAPMLPGMTGGINAIVEAGNGDLLVGGTLRHAGNVDVDHLARRSGGIWSAFAPGLASNQYVFDLAILPNQDVVAVGNFLTIGAVTTNGIARWNGTAWQGLGSGMASTSPGNTQVTRVRTLPNGDLVAAGRFDFAGGVPASNIARWNGAAWQSLGAGLVATVAPPPILVVSPGVHDLHVAANGDVLAVGYFQSAGGVVTNNVARWNGIGWQGFGGVAPLIVDAVTELANGDIVIGGPFVLGGSNLGLARWDGSAWQPFAAGLQGTVTRLLALPDGNLIVAGNLGVAGGSATVARWNGLGWQAVDVLAGASHSVGTLRAANDGSVLLGGAFTGLGSVVSASLAQLASSCPATAVASGATCTGSSGTATLSALTLPWLGATLRTRATGLPANGLALVGFGFNSVNVPLTSILPYGVAGCAVLTSLDDVAVQPGAATLTTMRSVPTVPALVGASFQHQVGALATNASGAFVEFVTTNRLTLTIGVF